MSEKLELKSPEQSVEQVELKGAETKHEASTVTPEQQAEHAEVARAAAHEAATSTERLALPVDDKPADNQPLYIDKVVKKLKLKQNLGQIRGQLSPAKRALSRVVHQPVVRAVSEASARTVTRPSGLLGGGLCAFIGSLAYLYLAKHIGFSYNYMLFLVLLVGGFAIGVALEMLLWLVRPKHQE